MASIIKCPSCTADELRCIGEIPPSYFFAGHALGSPLSGGSLYECLTCHLFFRFPRSSPKDLNALYASGSAENWPSPMGSRTDWRLIRDWIRTKKGIRHILDVGCYDGRLLESIGQGFLLYGVEIHEDAARRATSRGVEIIGSDFADLSDLGPIADLTIASDVIEHSADPKQFIAALASTVRPGGYILITTGNTDAMSWRLMGSRYWYCFIAEHISFINPGWVKHIAPQLALELEHLSPFSHSDSSRALRARIYEFTTNLLLRFAPAFFAFLRRRGFGGINLQTYPELDLSPPGWITARDHMLLVFRKASTP